MTDNVNIMRTVIHSLAQYFPYSQNSLHLYGTLCVTGQHNNQVVALLQFDNDLSQVGHSALSRPVAIDEDSRDDDRRHVV